MNYKISRYVTSGLHGDVYIVTDNNGITFVSKYIKLSDGVYQCILEPSILQTLQHANIVKIKDVVTHDHGYSIIEEVCYSDIATVRLKTHAAVMIRNLNWIKKSLYQLLCAVCYLHTNNIIHCDIRPTNILLTNVNTPTPGCIEQIMTSSTCKLCDFSISRFDVTGVFRHKRFCNPSYRAPEIWNEEEYNTGLDIWALGCCFYEIIAGVPLLKFEDDNDPENLKHTLKYFSTLSSIKITTKFNCDPCMKPDLKKFIQLIESMLIVNKYNRPSALDLLTNSYFDDIRNVTDIDCATTRIINIFIAPTPNELDEYSDNARVKQVLFHIINKLKSKNITIYIELFHASLYISEMITLKKSSIETNPLFVNFVYQSLDMCIL